MQPERKIEKLLRAFAKKRRADAGDAFKLHPVTRRLLHGEAARRAPKPGEGSFFAKLFGRWRPGLVLYATCFAVVVFIGAALLLPSFSKAKTKSRSQMAGTKNFSTPAAPELAAKSGPLDRSPAESQGAVGSDRLDLAGAPAQREIAETRMPASDFTSAHSGGGGGGGGESKNTDLPAATVALSAGDFGKNKIEADEAARKKLVAETRATGEAALLFDRDQSVAAAAKTLALQPPGTVAGTLSTASKAEAPAATGLRLDGLATQTDAFSGKLAVNEALISNTATLTQKFAQQSGNNASAQNLFKNAAASAKLTQVLANFQFQQNGSAVAVVDEDGSVYNGFLVAADETKLRNEPADLKRAPAKAALPSQKQAKDSQTEKNLELSAQNYFFRVSGTNRSLRQNVVFTGSVLTLSNALPASSQTFGSSFNRVGGAAGNISQVTDKNLYQQSLFSNSRIAGTAVVNSTNEIEINALPVAP